MEGKDLAQDIHELVVPVAELCRRAGSAIMAVYSSTRSGNYDVKADQSPLTDADMHSHEILTAGLDRLTPGVPVLSEESDEVAVAERLSWSLFWLVDPLDGTKEFLARTDEFTINIALVHEGVPRLGVLYQPVPRLAYIGIPGGEAVCYDCSQDRPWPLRRLGTRRLNNDRPMKVLASRRHRGRRIEGCLQWLERHWNEVERDNSGSAMKFCQLAEGDGDLYPRFSPCSEWDIAAGQALLEAAGGHLVTLTGKPVYYNRRRSLLSPAFYAIADPAHKIWEELLLQRFD